MSTQAAVPDFDADLFSSEVFSAYFNAREHEVYFHSLRHIGDRRNFYPKIVTAFANLCAFCEDATNLRQLDAFIFCHRKRLENLKEDLRILDYLKKTNLRGVELLCLAGTLTFDSLKAAYWKAAKKHHPDVGGSNEAMKMVNIAYGEFHDVISQWEKVPTTEKATDGTLEPTIGYLEFEIRSASEYLNWLAAILVSVHADSWAVDRTCTILQSLSKRGYLSNDFAKQPGFKFFFVPTLFRLATRLHTVGLAADARFVCDCGSALAAGVSYFELDRTKAEAILNGRQRLMVVIKHPCQAENLFRLNVIDERRYCETQARFEKHTAGKESIESELARFQEHGGFIDLSYDAPFRCELEVKPLVPVPKSGSDRIYHISDQQRSEYFRAFSASASSEALRKYLTIRISSCLCSLVYKFSDEEAEKIENECQFLQKLFPEWAVDLDIILEVSKHIRQLDSTNRMEKLNLLQKLDTTGGRSGATGTNLCGESQTDIHIRIEPTPRYLSVVKASASSLRMAVQTGSIHSADEENEWLKAREHDFNLIQNLGQNSIGTTARDAICHHRDDPDKVVAALKPHIEQLLDAANKISPENLGSLQLWYSIDGISAALVKLKKWDESRFWLELFFNLDIHLQESVPKSEKEKMLKRLERCKSLC